MESLRQKLYLPSINGNTLKLIAVITMFIDHIGAVLIENGVLGGPYNIDFTVINASAALGRWWSVDQILRGIVRVSFPIYCFLLVEGFLHTRDVKRYGMRLLAFSLISEIPFDLAVFQKPFYLGYQNVFFTLLLGLVALWGLGRRNESLPKSAAVVAVCCGAAWLLKTDYDMIGVCLIVLFYMAKRNEQIWMVLAVLLLCWEPPAAFSLILIAMYDGTRGSGRWKYWFYGFYPVHLLALWGIGQCLF